MMKLQNVAAVLALSSIAALSACSGYNNNSPPNRINHASP